MTKEDIINNISKKGFDKDYFVNLALESEKIRDIYIELLLNHKHIMVYYHVFYVLDTSTQINPLLFYGYFPQFEKLLTYSNSYHRDIGIRLIANLTIIDQKKMFEKIVDKYLNLFFDEKYMTSEYLVKNLGLIIESKEKLAKKICNFLIDNFSLVKYKEKQKDLLEGYIITALEKAYIKNIEKELIKNYVKEVVGSRSPKSRKIAKEFLKKYNLEN